jgi:hypothetical protein
MGMSNGLEGGNLEYFWTEGGEGGNQVEEEDQGAVDLGL